MLQERTEENATVDGDGGSGPSLRRTQAHQRERGLWSFLTWSFFLSQVAGSFAFAGGATKAAGESDLASVSKSSGAQGPTSSTPYSSDAATGSAEDLRAGDVSSNAAASQAQGINPSIKITAVDGHDMVHEAGMTARIMEVAADGTVPSSAAQPPSCDEGAVPPCVLPSGDGDVGSPTPNIPTDPAVVIPGIDVVPPVLDTVGDLIDNLGPSLDDLFVPVVETAGDLVGLIDSTIDQVLSPVASIAEGAVGTLAPTVEQLLTPITDLTSDIGEIVGPLLNETLSPVTELVGNTLGAASPALNAVGDVAGQIMAVADPLVDGVVSPLLSPLTNIVDAAQPLVDPVVDVVSPLVDVAEPLVQPIVSSLSPVLQPLAPLTADLPLVGGTGLLDGLLGTQPTDAVSSSGDIQFASEASAAPFDLFEQGTYTEYGLAMHDGAAESASSLGDLVDNLALPISSLIGTDDNSNPALPINLGALHHDISLRGIGDGLL